MVCLNKADLNPARAQEVEAFCLAGGLSLVGAIPFDIMVTEAMVQGQPVTAYAEGPVAQDLRRMWEKVKEYLDGR